MYKVLLVDDEPSVIERLIMVDWNKYGFSVCGTADNGEDALEIIRLCDPDLVVTDLKMPVIDGLRLISISIEKLNSKAKFVILTGYGEFTFAREAMKLNASGYMLKPLDDTELDETMSKIAQQIRSDRRNDEYTNKRLAFVARQTIRRIIGGEGRQQLLERVGILLDIGEMDEIRCLLIDVGQHKFVNGLASDPGNWSKKNQARNIIESALGEYRLNLFEDNEERFGIILYEKMPFYNSIGSFASKLETQLKGCIDESVLLSISAPAKGISLLEKAYTQSRLALNFAFFLGEGCLIRYEDIKNKDMDNAPFMENTHALLEVISKESADEITLSIERLFCRFLEDKKAPGPVKAFARNFVFEAVKLIDGLKGDPDEFIQLAVELDRVEESLTIWKLHDSFLKLCLQLSKKIHLLKQSNNRDIVSELKSYIKSNYYKDIKLKELASVFYMNPVYLGQLYKNSTGMQFNEYLHTVRIEEAKKLLRRTGMKISEIALAVGYKDPKYFLSKFQSFAKQAPSDYKNKSI
jgi:two-component system, response regulator YesN